MVGIHEKSVFLHSKFNKIVVGTFCLNKYGISVGKFIFILSQSEHQS